MFRKLLALGLGLGMLIPCAGCTRQRYRASADKEVYGLLNTAGQSDPLWNLDGFTLEQDPLSRYANLHDPDKQPMPPDDETANQLMQSVDGKRGSRKWYQNGYTDTVENQRWVDALPMNNEGKLVIDQDAAFDLALRNSPDYRTAMENLYLSALSVTAERFAFDVKFFGGESLLYNNSGGFRNDSVSTLRNDLGSGRGGSTVMSKRLATGGTIVADIANSMVWTFGPNGDQSFNPTTTLSYGLTQPLLRGAGRAIVLEDLTRSERRLLANVRQLAFYQQGFYVGVLTGANPVTAPSSGAYPTRRISNITTGGYYGLLSSQVQIRNQQSQLESLKDNLSQYEEFFKAGRLNDKYQVEQVRNNFLTNESSLVSSKNSYQNSVESYLISLGLPPDVRNVTIKDSLLDQFTLMSPTLTTLYNDILKNLGDLRNREKPTAEDVPMWLGEYEKILAGGLEEIDRDLVRLDTVIPSRKEALASLKKRLAGEHAELDSSFCDATAFDEKISLIKHDYEAEKKNLANIFRLMELTILRYNPQMLSRLLDATRDHFDNSPLGPEVLGLIRSMKLEDHFERNIPAQQIAQGLDNITDPMGDRERDPNASPQSGYYDIKEPYRYWMSACMSELSESLITLRLIQTRIRLESVELSVVDLEPEDAFAVARENRLDWMNVRSELVDSWRNIEIVANQLLGSMNVSVDGRIANEGSNPLNFSAKNASFSTGVTFDAPLTRLLERNDYRRVLISYDQTRRGYYNYVDTVNYQIRQTLRSIYLSQMDLELKRESVRVAIIRVHITQLKLNKPPTATSTRASATLGDNVARDLVDALDSLLNSQNSFMTTWLGYQVQRMAILLEMGLFQLDENGKWVDPGVINHTFLLRAGQMESTPQDRLFGLEQLRSVEEITGGLGADALGRIGSTAQTPALSGQYPANAEPLPAVPYRAGRPPSRTEMATPPLPPTRF